MVGLYGYLEAVAPSQSGRHGVDVLVDRMCTNPEVHHGISWAEREQSWLACFGFVLGADIAPIFQRLASIAPK